MIQDRLRQSPRVGKIEQLGVVGRVASTSTTATGGSAPPGSTCRARAAGSQQRNINLPGGTVELTGRASRQAQRQAPARRRHRRRGRRHPRRIPALPPRPGRGRPGLRRPARMLNFRTVKSDPRRRRRSRLSVWTTRAITLAVRQVKGTQIADFGRDVDAGARLAQRASCPTTCGSSAPATSPSRCRHKIDAVRSTASSRRSSSWSWSPAVHGVAQRPDRGASRSRSPWR